MPSPFDPSFEALPRIVPIFPLPGALLLPHGKLPLNIFEPRYLAMTLDAIAGDRMIGMIQPDGDPQDHADTPSVYRTGCSGRITSFSETDDGRLLITLSGTCRFNVVEELPLKDGYRRVVADYHRFRNDLSVEHEIDIDRDRLLGALRSFLTLRGVVVNWDAIEQTEDEQLVISLSMMCPFGVSEKQALLEAPNATERAKIMGTLLEMALLERADGDGQTRQ